MGGSSFLWSQLSFQPPTLVMSVLAAALALAHLRRSPAPSLVALFGIGLSVCAGVGVAVAQARLHGQHGSVPGEFARSMAPVNFAGNCARSLGLALVAAAVLAGREPRKGPRGL